MDVLQQGDAEGLCGIYAVLNFLQQTDWAEDDAEDGLQYLLECADGLGWFTPHYITEGYEDYQLKEILDLQISRYRLAYKTYFVADTIARRKISSFVSLVALVEKARGAIVASKSRRDHWVLVSSLQKETNVWDSSNGERRIEAFPKRTSGYSKNFGVVIVPSNPSLVAWI